MIVKNKQISPSCKALVILNFMIQVKLIILFCTAKSILIKVVFDVFLRFSVLSPKSIFFLKLGKKSVLGGGSFYSVSVRIYFVYLSRDIDKFI